MNVYVLSPEAKDAELVVNRLTDQEVSNVAGEDGELIFRMYPNACEFDKETYTWKSNMASPPRLEEMDTDVLPDYEEDADNDDCHGNTAKKARFSSYATSSYLGQCLSNAGGPNTSQIYTGAFENSNANEAGQLRKNILHLSIFLIPWRAKISGILHRLFLTTVGIYILAVNTESRHKENYRESLVRMLDSFWAFSRGKDNRFPKVIIAATTFNKETSANVCQDISNFLSDLLMGKPYEYLPRGEACLIISQYLKHDQTKDLKRLTKELLQNIPLEASISDQIIEKFEYFRKTGKKVLVQIPFDSANSSLDVGDEGLSYLHATRLIFSAHGKSPKWIILDPEFLVSLFLKIVEHDCKARQVNQDIETGQIRFYRETDLKKVIGSENGDVILEAMLDVGLLAKAMKNARPDNMFALINNGEVPDKLQSLRYLPDQKECPHFHSPILCIKFKDACIVESAFRLMKCRLLRTYPYETQGKRIFLYRDFAAFKVSEDNQEKQRLSLLYINEYMFVFILVYTTRPGSIEPKLCVEIRKILEDAIREGFEADQKIEPDASNSLLVTEKRTIEYEYLIRCPDTTDKKLDDEGLVSVSDLLRDISTVNGESALYTCSNHSDKPQPHYVDAVSLVRPWFPEKLRDHAGVDTTVTPTLTPAVNDHRLDQIVIAKIAKCIGQGWQFIGLQLRLDKPTIDKITEDNPRNTDKAITDMLMKCLQDRKGEFTLQDVRKCIEKNNVTVNWDEFNKLYEYEVNRT